MALGLCNLRSGSKGNSSVVLSEDGALLVDAGISRKCILDELRNINLSTNHLKGILITHEHSDHVAGLNVLLKELNLPIYATEATFDALFRKKLLPKDCNCSIIEADNSFFACGMEILPFSIPHDAADPVAYKFFKNGSSISVCTDLGHISKKTYEILKGSDIIMIESNHDVEMLKNTCKYPEYLKKRILGRSGHLSNEICSNTIVNLCENGTKHFILAHLSQNSNTYELAYQSSLDALISKGAQLDVDFSLLCARQDKRTSLYMIKQA